MRNPTTCEPDSSSRSCQLIVTVSPILSDLSARIAVSSFVMDAGYTCLYMSRE